MIYKLKAPAKINLSLDVVGKREDGYHNLKSVMHTIPLYDELEFEENELNTLKIATNKPGLCSLENNIVYKAYKAFYENTSVKMQGFDVKIIKNIPDSAGLAGGSSDGAETLKFLNKYHNYPYTEQELLKISASVGADLPFLIKGGCCLCEGIGDILTPLPILPDLNIVVAKPNSKGLSTPEIFSKLRIEEIKKHPDTDNLIDGLVNKNLEKICSNVYNVLEEVSKKESPEIKVIENLLLSNGAKASVMSGSGNSVFGLFDTDTKNAIDSLKNSGLDLFIVGL